MPKFKKGDYVILREDARYPVDGSLWSTVDKSLICGDLFKVDLIGDYKWSNGNEYVGHWQNDKRYGFGKLIFYYFLKIYYIKIILF